MSEDFQVITTKRGLSELTVRLQDVPCIAVDTEFVWERTYYAQLGLVQIALDDGTCFLVDPVAVRDISPLGDVLCSRQVVKVLHDAPQDLMILRRATGVSARNVFDTRLAAGFAGLDASISLGGLLSELLDVQLPKEHTRTDWVARPLASVCLEYAADDVRYLPSAMEMLRERSRDAEVEQWLDEELAVLDDSVLYEEKDPDQVYRRIRAAASLSPEGLSVLQELAAWREREASAMDRPRRWVAEDNELVAIAIALPRNERQLQQCDRLNRHTVRRHRAKLFAAVKRGIARLQHDPPEPVPSSRSTASLKARVNRALEHIRSCAREHHVDPQLLGSRKDVTLLLNAGAAAMPTQHSLLRGWRQECLGDLRTLG